MADIWTTAGEVETLAEELPCKVRHRRQLCVSVLTYFGIRSSPV